MVASSVASKGLDFSEIQHVINYSMPKEIEVSPDPLFFRSCQAAARSGGMETRHQAVFSDPGFFPRPPLSRYAHSKAIGQLKTYIDMLRLRDRTTPISVVVRVVRARRVSRRRLSTCRRRSRRSST